MNTKLGHIQNWQKLAQDSKWQAKTLAKACGVSLRTLERFFIKYMNNTPKSWLHEQRQRQAIKLLHDGFSVKESAAHLGYKHSTNFTRNFRIYWGFCPTAAKSVNQ